jgi:cytochrome c peroxidase
MHVSSAAPSPSCASYAWRLRALALGAMVTAALLLTTEMAAGQGQGRGGGFGDGNGRGGRGGGGVGPGATPLPFEVPLGLSASGRVPAVNPITPEKIALGRRLFFDPALSDDRTVSCATCHQPDRAFADETPLSEGILGRKGGRNTPTLVNRVYGRSFFWDGRARTLEEAVLMPVRDTLEMAMDVPRLIERVRGDATYRTQFAAAFPGAEVGEATVAQALATYVRSLVAGNSAFDRFRGGDATALSASAQRGQQLFFGRARCATCHQGANFTDEGFEGLGIPSSDPGRFAATGNARDRGNFKVPTLRDVALTAPYMHDGSVASLDAVVDFYDRGGGLTPGAGGRRRRDVRPLGLDAGQKQDLVAFLRALTSEDVRK